ncbi:sugar kinase [Mycolicibacterium tokaiense]|uniref:sugar kinase n=1 Tax=Mycolicibacterium tokaiense TaxID=39695 RepID=UPI000E1B8CAA
MCAVTSQDPVDVVTVGESMGLITAERVGSLSHVREMQLGFGGAESNVAIGVARLGGSAAWIGRVGADSLGHLIMRELRAESVETVAIVDPEAATAVMLKERPSPGSSRLTYYRRFQAGSRLRPSDIPRHVIERGRILHVTGITAALGERPRLALHAAIDHAKAANRVVSFDVNHRASLWTDRESAVSAYRALARRADIVFAGEDEAELVTGASDVRGQVDGLLALGVGQVVIKRGARGAVAARGSTVHTRDAHRITVADTVGAGDAFVAGWLAETARGAPPQACLEVASACGALACTSLGDWEAAPTREDVARLSDTGADPVSR